VRPEPPSPTLVREGAKGDLTSGRIARYKTGQIEGSRHLKQTGIDAETFLQKN
jgi:hypothetical protein